MNNALEKVATYTAPELFVLSLLAGGGGFGSMRLVNDMQNNIKPLQAPRNDIQLELHNPHKHHDMQLDNGGLASADPGMGTSLPAINKAAETPDPWTPYMAVGAGLPLGFLGAKSLYDKYQAEQMAQKVEHAKQQYSQQLMLAQNMGKMAGETPNVDKLCQAMADEMEKSALNMSGLKRNWPFAAGVALLGAGGAAGMTGANPLGAIGIHPGEGDPAIPGITHADIVSRLPNTPEANSEASSTVTDWAKQGWKNMADKLSGGATSAGAHLWHDIAGLSSIGMLGMLINNHNKKKEREQKANYPTSLQYAE